MRGLSGWGPNLEKVGPEGSGKGGSPKFRTFFPSPPQFSFFSPSLEVLPWICGSRPNLAKPDLAILIWSNWPIFDRIWPNRIWPILFLVGPGGVGARRGGGPEGWGPGGAGARRGGSPEGWGPGPRKSGTRRGGGPEAWGGPKISRFFSLSCRKFHFLLSLWGSSSGILVVFEAPGRSNVHVWALWLSCGVELWPLFKTMHGPQNAGWCHSVKPRRPDSGHSSTRRLPKREERKKFPAGERKKNEILGGPEKGGPAEGGPGERPKTLEHTHHTHKQQHLQAPTGGTNRRHQQAAPTGGTNRRHQQQQQQKFWPIH